MDEKGRAGLASELLCRDVNLQAAFNVLDALEQLTGGTGESCREGHVAHVSFGAMIGAILGVAVFFGGR